MFDTIIKGGRVVDGSGLPSRIADIGIALGMIADIAGSPVPANDRRRRSRRHAGIVDVHTTTTPSSPSTPTPPRPASTVSPRS